MSTERIRVLYFVDRFLRGGIQTLLWNIATSIDRSSFDVEFLCLDDGKVYPMERDLVDLGFKVTKLHGIWLHSPLDYVRYRKALARFFGSNASFDVVHVHSTGKNYPIFKAAQASDCAVRILHSHSTGYMTANPVKSYIGNGMNRVAASLATRRFACGQEAGEWMFGADFGKRPTDYILRNAVDCSKYRFNPSVREEVRSDLGLMAGQRMCINVARLAPVKNHSFLLRAFKEALSADGNLRLFIVGDGDLREQVAQQLADLGLTGKATILGFRNDVPELLQAADCFLMPSIHEGLPFVMVEAQASGLPCLISDGVTPEASMLPTTETLELCSSLEEWGYKIAAMATADRFADPERVLAKKGYDLKTEIKRLEDYYRDAVCVDGIGQ